MRLHVARVVLPALLFAACADSGLCEPLSQLPSGVQFTYQTWLTAQSTGDPRLARKALDRDYILSQMFSLVLTQRIVETHGDSILEDPAKYEAAFRRAQAAAMKQSGGGFKKLEHELDAAFDAHWRQVRRLDPHTTFRYVSGTSIGRAATLIIKSTNPNREREDRFEMRMEKKSAGWKVVAWAPAD